MWLTLAAVLCVVGSSVAYPSGAPTEVCDNMVPNHGASVQKSSAPYKLKLSKTTYNPGDVITVTLENTTDLYFEGLVIQARRANPTLNGKEAIGTFRNTRNDTDLKYLACNNMTQSAITHTREEHFFQKQVDFIAPAKSEGPLILGCTVVKNKATYWLPSQVFSYIDDATAGAIKKNPWGEPPTTTDDGSGAARGPHNNGVLLGLLALVIGVLPAIAL